MEDKYLSISNYFIILLLLLYIQLNKVFLVFGLNELNFWMFEIFFMALINSKLFDLPIYRHKILGMLIIILFGILFKIISIIYRLKIDEYNILNLYFSALPIGIILNSFIKLLMAYTFCKIKWICDTKYIPPSKILILYNLSGTILCFIASIIIHFNPCIELEIKSNNNKSSNSINEMINFII